MKIRKSILMLSLVMMGGLGILIVNRGTAPVVQDHSPVPVEKPLQEAKIDVQVSEQPVVDNPQVTPAVNTNLVKTVKFTIKPRAPQINAQ